MGKGRAAEDGVKQPVELDVPGEVAGAGDESLILDAARAAADVGRHGNYNRSSLGSHSAGPTNPEAPSVDAGG